MQASSISSTKQSGRKLERKKGITACRGDYGRKKKISHIRPQYQATPKINPSLSLNFRKNKVNAFLQSDWLYNQTLNKNDFTTRYYDNGDTIYNQVKRNRITTTWLSKAGLDWNIDEQNAFSVSGCTVMKYIRDNGDIPYFNAKDNQRQRLGNFMKTKVSRPNAILSFQHKFKQPGHLLNVGFNYTFTGKTRNIF